MSQSSVITFTPEEEKKIQEAVVANQEKARQELIDTIILNRTLDAQSQQPGYRYG